MTVTPKVKSVSPESQHFCSPATICRRACAKSVRFEIKRERQRFVGKSVGQHSLLNFSRINACAAASSDTPLIIGSYRPETASVFAMFAIQSNSELAPGDFLYKTKDGLLTIELTTEVPHCLVLAEDTFAISMQEPETLESDTSIMIGV